MGESGKFFDVQSTLYKLNLGAIQDFQRDETLKKIAADVGVEHEEWVRNYNDPEISAQVQRDIEEGMRIGVRGVPTIFANGRLIESLKPEDVELLLQMARAGGGR